MLARYVFLHMKIKRFIITFFAVVTEESWPGLNCAADLHNSLSFLPPRGRSIFQLLPIPQTGNLTF